MSIKRKNNFIRDKGLCQRHGLSKVAMDEIKTLVFVLPTPSKS